MYNRDVKLIAEHGLSSEAGLLDIIEFVFATIQQPLSMVPMIRDDIAVNGLDSRFLFGFKRGGLQYAQDNAKQLLDDISKVVTEHGTQSDAAASAAIEVFFKVPGLGAVKAGFVAQCLGFNTACIDSHNVARLGIPVKDVTISKKLKPVTVCKKINNYVKLTQLEGSEYWWDTWCEYVAGNKMNKELTTGDVVSQFHVECIIREPIETVVNGFAI